MEPIRILVVEDDPDFQYLIQQSLSEQSDFALICDNMNTDKNTALYEKMATEQDT